MACTCKKIKCPTTQGGGDICTRCKSEGFYCETHNDAINKNSDCCYDRECGGESPSAGFMLAAQLSGKGGYSDEDLKNQMKKQMPSATSIEIK